VVRSTPPYIKSPAVSVGLFFVLKLIDDGCLRELLLEFARSHWLMRHQKIMSAMAKPVATDTTVATRPGIMKEWFST
jgi:hypothetical protein